MYILVLLFMRRKSLVLAMVMALTGLCACSGEQGIEQVGDVMVECPYIEPILGFGSATVEDVRNKEERTLYQDWWDDNALITTQDRCSYPWTAYIFNENGKTLDFCALTLEKSKLPKVTYYLENRYGEALPKRDKTKLYVDKERGCGILLVTDIEYEEVIGLAYLPVNDMDRLIDELMEGKK